MVPIEQDKQDANRRRKEEEAVLSKGIRVE